MTFVNREPTRNLGAEVWVEERLSREASASVSYSWQGEPEIRDADEPFPPDELALPPTHRLNDVLTSQFHSYSPGYAMAGARQLE